VNQAPGDFLGLAGRTVLVSGVANKKSVAWHVHRGLVGAGATVVHTVRSEARKRELERALAPSEVFVCDVERAGDIERLAAQVAERHPRLDGFVHSIAFARYDPRADGPRAFHQTPREDFLQALDVSCFSLIAFANALQLLLAPRASVVTISISDTHLAAESYGFMAPAKAALDSTVAFLAKSFSAKSEVRFNAVKAGPLKTSASAGIPNYLENYLFAEAATLRHRALATEEVANAVLFLLSERSSGVNAQGLVVDAGMGVNFFDSGLVRNAMRPPVASPRHDVDEPSAQESR
jgi:enoyl-[acyl-carrier protein] reductase I